MPIDNAPTDFELGSRRDRQSKMDGRRARSVLLSAALAAGLCALAVVATLVWQTPGRVGLLGSAAAVRARMQRFGAALEREGEERAGAELIAEAREIGAHTTKRGQRITALRKLEPGQTVGQTGAPFTQGRYGREYDAPHVGGTNGVFIGSNGGGVGLARRPAPRHHYSAHKGSWRSDLRRAFKDVRATRSSLRTLQPNGPALAPNMRRLPSRVPPTIPGVKEDAWPFRLDKRFKRRLRHRAPATLPGVKVDSWAPWNDWKGPQGLGFRGSPEGYSARQKAVAAGGAEHGRRPNFPRRVRPRLLTLPRAGEQERGGGPSPRLMQPNTGYEDEEGYGTDQTYEDYYPYDDYDFEHYGENEEGDAFDQEYGRDEAKVAEAEKAHEQVATGFPAAYDGQWGAQYYRNAGGNEGAMKRAGINYDDYPLDVYRSLPFLPYDPSATTQRKQNQKVRAGKHLEEPYRQEAGANAGGENMAAGWGTWVEGGAAEDHVRKAGITIDHDPLHFRSAFPNPAWDPSEYDQARHVSKAPAKDAWEAVQNHRASQVPMESAGVRVNGYPTDSEPREFNQVDGLMDTLVNTQDTPKYRDEGVAAQEQPLHFLLGDDPDRDTDTQAESINKLFAPGKFDRMPQNLEDKEQGIEYRPDAPVGFPVQDDDEDEDDEYSGDDGWDEGEWESRRHDGQKPALKDLHRRNAWNELKKHNRAVTWPHERQWVGVNF